MVPVFAIFSFLSIAFYDAAIYLKHIPDLYEAFALASFFILICNYVGEDEDERHAFIASQGATQNHIVGNITTLDEHTNVTNNLTESYNRRFPISRSHVRSPNRNGNHRSNRFIRKSLSSPPPPKRIKTTINIH
jgi:hypothetical protein